MAFTLKPLPFATDALEPHMSARTLEFHHGKHHKTYVETLNKLVAGTEFESMRLEEIVRETAESQGASERKIFNNAGQAWNHDFFWQCLAPDGGGEPDGEISDRIHKEFGSWQEFRKRFVEAAAAQFGSGWAWLVEADGKLRIVTTSNARTPIAHGQKPLLVCDVWEHAYYLDYQNERPKFVETFLDKLVNWQFAGRRLSLEGEGSYRGTRDYNEGVAKSVAKGRSGAQAKAAAQALDGAEGDELRAAEQAGKSRSHGGAQVEGEGSYSATRQYNSDLARTVAKGQAEHHARQARRALDSAEGEELRRAEAEGKARAHGEDPAVKKPGKRG